MEENKHTCSCSINENDIHEHENGYRNILISTILLFSGLIYQGVFNGYIFRYDLVKFSWYLVAYIPVALPVMKAAWETIKQKDYFNEFTLMTLATIGAFAIKEYPEGVAIMLFYAFGETLQEKAVSKVRKNISSLVNTQKKKATVIREGQQVEVDPQQIAIGETILVKVGERLPLDGILESQDGELDSSVLTGESIPIHYTKGKEVFSGMINKGSVISIKVTKKFEDSTLSRILKLVEDAANKKSQKEMIIRRFSRIYTPIVFALALLTIMIPFFFLDNYVFTEWLYKGLVLLVVSCPCALVISVPLGYFAGIGAASKKGILFKGANILDTLKDANTVVLDKTGTVTKGVFDVQEIVTIKKNYEEFLAFAKLIESGSNHPIAKAIKNYRLDIALLNLQIDRNEEIPGYGIRALINNKVALAGNRKLLDLHKINYPDSVNQIAQSHVLFAYDNELIGYIIVADELKSDAKQFIKQLRLNGIKHIEMLSGDREAIVQNIGRELEVDTMMGELLPVDKLKRIEYLKSIKGNNIAFVGDGINDTPAMALSNVGVAMGTIGADAAIEVADLIIQNDKLSYLVEAIKISKKTNQIIIVNILLILTVKIVVIIMGILGISTLWEAVFADVGVTILVIINSIRLLLSHK